MRKFDATCEYLCRMQANVFERSLELDCSSNVFYRTYMHLEEVKVIDDYPSLSIGPNDIDLFQECLAKTKGMKKAGMAKLEPGEMRWIGYVLRAWAYCHEVSSLVLYKQNRLEDLRALYLPYHTLDPLSAIERILDARVEKKEDIQEILKGIYKGK